ncbi:hypothetical protein LRAMOSA10305 [Lichtheimia ramosa]|uniref:Flavodoxin-like domain-containing protein n=1 Tax=Lichtheimia ramosa TaxID=688394 RepID=A0A077WNL4_9FUNG|nr:hypothetical protein LRAMOSA10305 [Lichtheimia ramosa]
MPRVHIFADKSEDSESKAKLLAKGIESKDKNVQVEIKDISYSPMAACMKDYTRETTDIEGVVMLAADAFLFSSTGALSVFEKHFLDNKDSTPLEGKKYGVLMTDKTTFDGPKPTDAHLLDQKLIERLAERGMSHYPVMVEQAHTDQQIEDAGHRFVEQAFAPVLH